MIDRYSVKRRVFALLSSPEQQFKVHHIINNHREIPLPKIPGTDTAYVRVETTAQIISSLYQYLTDSVGRRQTVRITITAIHHESDIVCTFIIFQRIQVIRKFHRIFFQVFYTSQLICVPQVSGEKPLVQS